MKISKRFEKLGSYAFAEIDRAKEMAKEKAKEIGVKVIDFGVGDPTDPYPKLIEDAIKYGAEKHRSSGYPSYTGMKEYREACAKWLKRRFGVEADPETQITSTIGSKEAVWVFPFTYINPGDKVLIPEIGYPPYKSGTIMAGGVPVFYELREENRFLPDLDNLEKKGIFNDVKIMWINYPHNPTTVKAEEDFLKRIIELSNKYGFIIASDEAYTEMYPSGTKPPISILQVTNEWENIIVFQSLSKRSNATNLRIGFAVGGENIINDYRKLRTQIDSGTCNIIQEAAIAAYNDEKHVEEMRRKYDERRNILTDALEKIGLPKPYAEATFYIWQKVPEEMTSTEFSKKLLEELFINTTPGAMLSLIKYNDRIPGDNYVRFALVPSKEDTEEAAKRLMNLKI